MCSFVSVTDTYLNVFDILAANIAQQWEDAVLAVSKRAAIVHLKHKATKECWDMQMLTIPPTFKNEIVKKKRSTKHCNYCFCRAP